MTVTPIKYARKPFFIEAVCVTAENVEEVATWCQGEVRKVESAAVHDEKYVKVHVHRPLNERQTKAFIGDWVLYAGTGFKVYTSKAFVTSFEPISDDEADGPGDVLFMAPGSDRVEELFVTAEKA